MGEALDRRGLSIFNRPISQGATMNRKHFLGLLPLFALLVSIPSLAGEKGGVTLPDHVTVAGKSLVLNGMGVREATIIKIDLYVAGLYLENKSQDGRSILASKGPKRLVLKFVRDVDQEDVQKSLTEGFRRNSASALPALHERIDRFNAWIPSMAKGESLAFSYLPTRGIEVNVNGSIKGIIAGDDFATALFSIWLGPHPPNPSLKSGLLGR